MNTHNWTPEAVVMVIVVIAAVLIPSVTGAVIAIIFARQGKSGAAQAALDALHKTGVPESITSLNAQMTEIAKLTPPPAPPTVIVQTSQTETK